MRLRKGFHRQAVLGLTAALVWICTFGARAEQVTLDAALDTPLLLSGSPQTAYLRVALKGFEMEESEQAAVNLAIVLDRSGSMQGAKLEEAKKAAVMAVNRLRDDDVVSVITYDTTVHVLVPATKAVDRVKVVSTCVLRPGRHRLLTLRGRLSVS